MKKKTLAVAAFAVLTFAGCLSNDGGGTSTPRAGVLIDLISPNATNTTVVLNGNTIGSNVSYGSTPQYYNQVVPGPANITVNSSTVQELLNKNFSTQPGSYYSAFIVDSTSRMKAIIVADSVDYPATTDSAKVRFYNFAPNSIPLNIRINDSINAFMQPHPFESQESAQATNIFLGVKAGTYHLQVLSPYNTTQALKDTSILLEGKHIYTVFIKGFYPDTTGATPISVGIVKHG